MPEHELAAGRHGWLQVARGSVELNGKKLSQGDGAAKKKCQCGGNAWHGWEPPVWWAKAVLHDRAAGKSLQPAGWHSSGTLTSLPSSPE